ncbi:MAG: NAD(P)-dependent oxidoreductase [Caldimonas sp.]
MPASSNSGTEQKNARSFLPLRNIGVAGGASLSCKPSSTTGQNRRMGTARSDDGIGIAGIGLMGLAMAQRLRDLGRRVLVRDIDAEREAEARAHGAEVCAAPAALAAGCDLLIVAVVDAAQCDAVLFGHDGAAASMRAGGCVMLCSTIGPADVERIAARLLESGVGCIDAPMSGGPARARDGSMSLMVACADAWYEVHRSTLEALSSRLFRVGERPGDGARTKLVNNLLAAVNLAGAAEAMALAERLGLDAARTLAVVEQSSGQSWIGSDRMRRVIAGDASPRARTALLAKDSALALEMAHGAGMQPAVGTAAAALFADACAAGSAERDDGSVLDLARSRAGDAIGAMP